MITEQEMMIPLLLSKSFLIFNSIINVLILQYLSYAQKCSKSSPMRTSPVPSAYLYIALSAMKELASGMRIDTGKVAESLILSSLAALRDG